MTSGSRPIRSNKHAAPESANHAKNKSRGRRAMKNAIGAATHKLRHWKQSTNLPQRPPPSIARKRKIKSAGPSSFASKCVIRQVARTPKTSRVQKASRILLRPALRNVGVRVQVVANLHRPRHRPLVVKSAGPALSPRLLLNVYLVGLATAVPTFQGEAR